jgi:hypothetical protein
MKVATAREGLRAACDDWFKDRGFSFVKSRDAYVRKFKERLQLMHLRFVVVASVVRVEMSVAIRFNRIEEEYHRNSGVPPKSAKMTSTLWIPAEALTGWPLEECHRRLTSVADVDAAARTLKELYEHYAESYFESHDTVESVAAELNADPASLTPHAAPPGRAFYGVIAAALSGQEGLADLIAGHRKALESIDRGFHNGRFDRMVDDLRRLA